MSVRTRTIRWLALLGVMLLAVALVPLAAAQDNDEEEPRLTLDVLYDGDRVIGVFEDEINAHLYAFVGQAGDVVTISMTQADDSILDPYLVLLGPAGEVYAADDDSGMVDLAAQISDFTLPEDGSYFVLATSFRGLRQEAMADVDPQEYELVIRGPSLPAGVDEVEAIEYLALRMEIGEEAVLAITPEEPVFYVTFLAEAGDVVSIITEELDQPVDTLLYLFDPFGQRVALNDDIDFAARNYYAAIEEYLILEDGLYLIFATAFDFNRAYLDNWANDGEFWLIID
jgi:hypothetical protein